MVHRGPAHHYQRQAFNGQVPSPTQRQSPLLQADISQKPIVNSVFVCGCVETLNWGWGDTGDSKPLFTPQRKHVQSAIKVNAYHIILLPGTYLHEVALLTHLDLQITYKSRLYIKKTIVRFASVYNCVYKLYHHCDV